MAKLTPEILEQMKKQKVYSLATASKDGVPNVVPVGMLIPQEDGAAFYVWNPDCTESWQIKGSLQIEDSGPDYEAAAIYAHMIKETFPAKHLVKMNVEEIYYVTPGDHAGKRIE